MDPFNQPLAPLLGTKTAEQFAKHLGITTTGQALNYFPRRYLERGELTPIVQLPLGEQVTVIARVRTASTRPMQARRGIITNVTVTDGNDDVAFSGPVVMLPQDGNFTSVGVVKVPDARPDRLAFEGFFFPTAVQDEDGARSAFPDALQPELFLNAWRGEPAEESGVPENVYVLDTTGLEPVMGDGDERFRMRLTPGTGTELPDELGTVMFDGWSRWVKIQVSSTPGNLLSLISLAVAVAGLCVSLFVRPRRLFVRFTDGRAAVDAFLLDYAALALAVLGGED